MPAKIFRFLLGVLLIPLTIGYSIAFYEQINLIHQIHTPELCFLLGITTYLAFHTLVVAPSKAYVFGHELMHAGATWVSGGQVKGFKVGKKSGSVKTTKSSGFIALAPYLIPIYSILWAILYGAAALFTDVRPWIQWFFFGLGVTLTFHLVFTVTVLKEKQPDLEVLGPLVSLNLITWGNISIVIGVMSLMIAEVRFWPYLTGGFQHARDLYLQIYHQLLSI